jgi:hypothetical protein
LPNYLHKYTVPEVLVEQSGSVHLVACNFTWLCNVFRTELIMKLLFWILKSVISYEGELELPFCHTRREDGPNTGNHSFGDG